MAASPVKLLPLTYLNANDDEYSATDDALRHELPWLPTFVHTVEPVASTTRSVPIVAPYMWYWKVTVETIMPADVHIAPLYPSENVL